MYVVTETIMYQYHITRNTEKINYDTYIGGFPQNIMYTALGWDG